MGLITCYSIKIELSKPAPAHLFSQDAHFELFLSANGVLCGPARMCQLDSKELADQLREAYMPRLQKRYGDDVKAEVFEGTEMGDPKKIHARIKEDSRIARKRLETGLLAPNAKLFD